MEIVYPVPVRNYRIAVGSFFFVAGLTFASWASRIPDIKAKLGLSEAGLGLILFALPVGQMVSLPLAAPLIGRFGSRPLLIGAALLYPLFLLPLAVAPSTAYLVAGLFGFGLFANLLNIAMNTQAVGVEQQYGRSIMASFHGLWSGAGFSGAAASTLLVSWGVTPLAHFALIAAFSAVLVLLFSRYTLPGEAQSEQRASYFSKPDKNILLLGAIAFCCMLCEGAMADWSGVYFQKVVEAPAAYITLGYTAFMGTMAAGRFMGDRLVTRFGVRHILQASGVLVALGLLLSIVVPHLVAATGGFLLVGFGVSSVIPIVYGLAGKSKQQSASAALAAVSTISFLGFLLGPPVIGFIAEASSLQWAFGLVALLGLAASLLSARIKAV